MCPDGLGCAISNATSVLQPTTLPSDRFHKEIATLCSAHTCYDERQHFCQHSVTAFRCARFRPTMTSHMRFMTVFVAIFAPVMSSDSPARAESAIDFARDVAPIFEQHC